MNEELINRNRNINRGFRKLIVWQEAINFYAFISKQLTLMIDISFKVKGQVDASAFSVHSNIAEGYARRSLKDIINFNNYALGSLAENYSQIYALFTAEKIDKEWFDNFDKVHYSLENKLLAYNKSLLKKLKNKDEWFDDYTAREDDITYE
ncbi:MAG: four helix bundle protein [Bacteroidales bacterium]|nr:four helix bundle protein [Bacteroidales bacterium]MCF8345554.1 four helix bundle protein [Bacteroidales bacterium]MCF8351051.1 four helix bundle protein [Bacteroidales bacterium]MCF8375883.1 four helix bundle protein [Bacteroidales bacterium]MCF8402015.1 four helix bundle protein [Bacteroidales bacterium]